MLTKPIKRAILEHTIEEYPREACGVIAKGKYYQCRNIATTDYEFQIHPADLLEFEGSIEAIVHSHPDASSKPSEPDLVMLEEGEVPWIICGYSKVGETEPLIDFGVYVPSGYKAPLLGRNFYHGVLDCYTLVKDFYAREEGIELPDFERKDKWWEDPEADSLYINNFEKAGFAEIKDTPFQRGDILIAQVGKSAHPNHALIYLGQDGSLKSEETPEAIGTAIVLHHMYGRKSNREIYGQNWSEQVVKVLRHKEKL